MFHHDNIIFLLHNNFLYVICRRVTRFMARVQCVVSRKETSDLGLYGNFSNYDTSDGFRLAGAPDQLASAAYNISALAILMYVW